MAVLEATSTIVPERRRPNCISHKKKNFARLGSSAQIAEGLGDESAKGRWSSGCEEGLLAESRRILRRCIGGGLDEGGCVAKQIRTVI